MRKDTEGAGLRKGAWSEVGGAYGGAWSGIWLAYGGGVVIGGRGLRKLWAGLMEGTWPLVGEVRGRGQERDWLRERGVVSGGRSMRTLMGRGLGAWPLVGVA